MILADTTGHIGVAILRAIANLAIGNGDIADMALLTQKTQGLHADVKTLSCLLWRQQGKPAHAAILPIALACAFSRGGIQNVGAKGRPRWSSIGAASLSHTTHI